MTATAAARAASLALTGISLLACLASGASAAPMEPSVNMTDPCYTNPTGEACASFERSAADWTDDLEKLCAAMPYMIGCDMWDQCKSGQAKNESGYCSLPSLVADICVADNMSRMKGCEAHNGLCATGTKVKQCLVPGVAPNVITTFSTKADIDGVCLSHSMDGCQQCSSIGRTNFASCPDPLVVISKLCISMPDMPQCASWHTMCDNADLAAAYPMVCTGDAADGSSSAPPPMKMWFHQGTREMFLFREWVPTSTGQYVGMCIAMCVLAVFTQALKAIRLRVEMRWSASLRSRTCCGGASLEPAGAATNFKPDSDKDSAASACCQQNGAVSSGRSTPTEPEPVVPSSQVVPAWRRQGSLVCCGVQLITRDQAVRNFWRACFTFIVIFLDYALMLVVMTFNVGIILAVCGGFAIGALLFGHVGEVPSKPPSAALRSGLVRSGSGELETVFVEGAACCSGGSGCGGGGHAGGQL